MKNKKGFIAGAIPSWLAWPILIIITLIFFIMFLFMRGCSNTDMGQIERVESGEIHAEYLLSYFLDLPWNTGNPHDKKTMTDLIIESENDDDLKAALQGEFFDFFFPNYYWAWRIDIYYPTSTIQSHFKYSPLDEISVDEDSRKQSLIRKTNILKIPASDRFEFLEDELKGTIEGVYSESEEFYGYLDLPTATYLSEEHFIVTYIPTKDKTPIKVILTSYFIPRRKLFTNLI